jgi:hypothetical protein
VRWKHDRQRKKKERERKKADAAGRVRRGR